MREVAGSPFFLPGTDFAFSLQKEKIMLDQLTHLVLVYQCRGIYKDILVKEINLHIYHFPGNGYELPEEDWGDFFLSIQQRTDALIDGFEYRGFSFYTYLNKTLQWHLKSFRSSLKRKQYDQWMLEKESIQNFRDSTEYNIIQNPLKDRIIYLLNTSGLTEKRRAVLTSRLFILILKNLMFIKETDYLECALALGFSVSDAMDIRIRLLSFLEPRLKRRDHLIIRRNKYYHKISCLEKQQKDHMDSVLRFKMGECCRQLKMRKEKINDHIRRINVLPTNSEISRVLKLPKGSVDSGLYYLREHLEVYGSKASCPIGGNELFC